MLPIGVQVFILLLLILANGIFSMSEIAIVASRRARLQQQAESGDPRAAIVLELAGNPDRFLGTVQIGITLVGILTGAYGGTAIADRLALYLQRVTSLGDSSHTVSFAAVVILTTYLTLILGELVPKRLGLHSPERIATSSAVAMRALSRFTSPVVRLLTLSTNLVLRLLRVGPPEESLATEEEIKVMLEQGTRAGLFESAEQEMIARVFRFGDRRVSALMTPRPDVVWLDAEDGPEELRFKLAESHHSRFPVGQGTLDDVLGIVEVKELFARALEGGELDLQAALQHPLFVPESMRALQVLELFRKSAAHVALVLDEYGSVQGLVTLYDVLEALVGDLPTEEEPEPLVVQREDGSWLVDGSVAVDELAERLAAYELPGTEREYQTLGGLVMTQLGRIPVAADRFEWAGFGFEVVDMDGNRVDKVLITRLPEEEPEEG